MEAEPNDTPAGALEVSGEVILMGSMAGADQDAWLWTVSDVDAQKRWTFELRGIPGRLTIVEILRVEYGENGVDVTGTDRLMKMGTRDGKKPSIHQDLVFEAGEYLLGIAAAGGGGGVYRPPGASLSFHTGDEPAATESAEPGAYRLIIGEGARLPLTSGGNSRNSREAALATRVGHEFAALTYDESSWYRFDFTEEQRKQRWDITAQVPVGRDIQGELFDEAGTSLERSSADARGKLAFRDLTPPSGSWWVELQKRGQDGFIQAIGSESVGARVAGEESEPNGDWQLANRVDLSQPLMGRVSEDSEWDYFRFAVSQELADRVLELSLSNASGKRLELCLLDDRKTRLQCRADSGDLVLPDLVLAAGEWGLSVSRGHAGTEYRIRLAAQGGISADVEAEPNDSLATASSVAAKNRIKGRLSGDESDFFRFVVTDDPQLWRFQVIGDGIEEVGYHDAAGYQSQRVRPAKGQGRARLDNVYLLPGVHHLQIRGKDGGEYTLLARPLGQPDPNGEREPNDDTRYMQNLAIGQTRTGLLVDGDKDYYRYFLANRDRIRLTIQPPSDGAVLPQLYWYGQAMKETRQPEVGEKIVLEGVFPPGDYVLALLAREASDAEYSVSLERLERFGCATDCEPNDNLAFANPVVPGQLVTGLVGDWRDRDVYRLPVRSEPTEWLLRTAPGVPLKVAADASEESVMQYDAAGELFRGVVPAGQAHYIFVAGNRPREYSFEIDYSGRLADVAGASDLMLKLLLELDETEVAAYRRTGQRVGGRVTLHNGASMLQTVTLDAVTSDYRWSADLEKSIVEVPAGGKISVPVTIDVPRDAWADVPVRVSVRISDASGNEAETYREITAGRDAPPVNPNRGWTIPEPLLGAFNVAWNPLGSKLAGRYDQSVGLGFENVFNGVDVRNQGLSLRGGWRDEGHRDIVIELAGGAAVDVVGIGINLFHNESAERDPSVIEFAVSRDGVTYTPVLEQGLEPVKTSQYFVLDEPVAARFARLRLTQNFAGERGGQLMLAEWQVFARPGTDISQGAGFNLADNGLGGHIVYSRPQASVHWDQVLLQMEDEEHSIRLNAGQEFEFVAGFHHNRAAQINLLEWEQSKGAQAANLFSEVRIAVSTESPFGPWKSLGTWQLGGIGETTVIALEQAEWARFVRFTGPAPDKRTVRAAPEAIRIRERPTDASYRSILTEWGYASKEAFYESQQELAVDQPLRPAGHGSREKAASITPGQTVGGAVSLGKHEHWYRLSVPAGQNTVTFQLKGDPTVRTALRFEDMAGDQIRLVTDEHSNTARSHVYEATVEAGKDYYLRVAEPPRNVVFVWDTSPSVLPYIPTIYNALVAFTEDVVPGRDAVNLLPFGTSPLLRDWYGEPYILQTVLNDYLRKESSSAAEASLLRASSELSSLPGTKAIVVVTDATTTRDAKVWDEFDEVRPRVFGIGVGGGRGARDEQDLFQNWTDVNDGFYEHIVYDGEMEIAFDRAATMLRRPAEYTLHADASFREDPGPGLLSVVTGEGGSASADFGGAVELILDASGSMWQRLDGRFRIDIAREVLAEAVGNYIPAGTPTALRVFGHREPSACRTDLEISLQPLDPAAAITRINAIDPKSLARTPIADSLAKIESDLAGAEGSKTVVLVTDGEETCDGEPDEVIRKLRDKGYDLTLNIVGFAIGDKELEQTFSNWADLGGGRYFPAGDQEGLREAIKAALQIPFAVHDASGSKVASGVVGGDPVELEAGEYRVVVSSRPQQTFENLIVRGGRPTTLELE